MKRIVLDARYLDGSFSGIATYSRLLIEHLALVDTENQYIVITGRGFKGPLKVGRNFELLSYAGKPVSFWTLATFGRLVRKLRPALVHSLFPLSPLGLKIPQVITVHDMQPFTDPEFSSRRPRLIRWGYDAFYRFAYPASIRRAKWVLCVSWNTRDEVATLLPTQMSKLIVAHHGLDRTSLELPSPERVDQIVEGYGLNRPYFLYYGSTRPNKNLAQMVKGFARMRDAAGVHGKDLLFVMILRKDRFFRSVERAIISRKLEDHVRVMAPVPEQDRTAILSRARALCFATKYEGFGFPPLEAMALGVPVLVSTSGSLPEICGDAALYCDAHSSESIANGMLSIHLNEDERLRLSQAGRLRAARFSWKDTAEMVRDVYNLLL